ncbi:hypothetical protein D9619_003542 [Psilocybe cf. subviscida]|uniref:Uncharacterized protein n=1 Tax=Psilocybe cf. subviscida TaxID=2480587 RepID=A0A8H5AWL9_9AGAR|nr:hypothetical protein D9619_003542 [Psilocybe cf. subviscida]
MEEPRANTLHHADYSYDPPPYHHDHDHPPCSRRWYRPLNDPYCALVLMSGSATPTLDQTTVFTFTTETGATPTPSGFPGRSTGIATITFDPNKTPAGPTTAVSSAVPTSNLVEPTTTAPTTATGSTTATASPATSSSFSSINTVANSLGPTTVTTESTTPTAPPTLATDSPTVTTPLTTTGDPSQTNTGPPPPPSTTDPPDPTTTGSPTTVTSDPTTGVPPATTPSDPVETTNTPSVTPTTDAMSSTATTDASSPTRTRLRRARRRRARSRLHWIPLPHHPRPLPQILLPPWIPLPPLRIRILRRRLLHRRLMTHQALHLPPQPPLHPPTQAPALAPCNATANRHRQQQQSTSIESPSRYRKSIWTVEYTTDANGNPTLTAPPFITTTSTQTRPDGSVTTFTEIVANPTLSPDNQSRKGSGFFRNTGAVAGVFVLVGLAFVSILLFIFFAVRRRRRTLRIEHDTAVSASLAAAGFHRTMLDDDDDPAHSNSTRGSQARSRYGSSALDPFAPGVMMGTMGPGHNRMHSGVNLLDSDEGGAGRPEMQEYFNPYTDAAGPNPFSDNANGAAGAQATQGNRDSAGSNYPYRDYVVPSPTAAGNPAVPPSAFTAGGVDRERTSGTGMGAGPSEMGVGHGHSHSASGSFEPLLSAYYRSSKSDDSHGNVGKITPPEAALPSPPLVNVVTSSMAAAAASAPPPVPARSPRRPSSSSATAPGYMPYDAGYRLSSAPGSASGHGHGGSSSHGHGADLLGFGVAGAGLGTLGELGMPEQSAASSVYSVASDTDAPKLRGSGYWDDDGDKDGDDGEEGAEDEGNSKRVLGVRNLPDNASQISQL